MEDYINKKYLGNTNEKVIALKNAGLTYTNIMRFIPEATTRNQVAGICNRHKDKFANSKIEDLFNPSEVKAIMRWIPSKEALAKKAKNDLAKARGKQAAKLQRLKNAEVNPKDETPKEAEPIEVTPKEHTIISKLFANKNEPIIVDDAPVFLLQLKINGCRYPVGRMYNDDTNQAEYLFCNKDIDSDQKISFCKECIKTQKLTRSSAAVVYTYIAPNRYIATAMARRK